VLRVCTWVADTIEVVFERLIELLTTRIERICREVTEQIEQWQQRFEQRCEQVSRQVCRWLPWPLDKLCDWVTETVCKLVSVLVKVIVTIIRTICETVVSVIRVIIRIPMTILLTIMRIVCFVIDFIISWIKIIVSIFIGLPEFLLCLLGLRIRKHLHICVTVLADRRGTPVLSDAQVSAIVAAAAEIISNRMNVRVREHGRRIIRVPTARLTVTACNASQLFSSEAVDLSTEGVEGKTFSELLGCADDVVDVASEVIHDVLNVIFIRDIVEGDDVGCHIPGTNYVIVDRSATGLVLAHEIGHAGDLWHVSGADNLMNHFTAGDAVAAWQQCIFRRSRFVVYVP
jgi:hypothetical protein